jgi:NAD(P)-dependent dehydrogenase (short-subunit alcohol dehydrogenase family)
MRVVTPFNRESTADEVAAAVDLTGCRAIITGGGAGIGLETARALSRRRADVTLAVRNLQAGHDAAQDIQRTTGGRVDVAYLDLADLDSVRQFAANWRGPLHILVNNAGVMATPQAVTPQGWELQFATNHLGHFAFAIGLHRAMAQAGKARIVSLSSGAHRRSPVVFDDLHFERRSYDPWLAYGQSKTANILFAVAATRHWEGQSISANAATPGRIWTGLLNHLPDAERDRMRQEREAGTIFWKTPQQGAATTVLLAISPLVDGVGGRYFEDCAEAACYDGDERRGVASYALDPELAERLWAVSLRMISES